MTDTSNQPPETEESPKDAYVYTGSLVSSSESGATLAPGEEVLLDRPLADEDQRLFDEGLLIPALTDEEKQKAEAEATGDAPAEQTEQVPGEGVSGQQAERSDAVQPSTPEGGSPPVKNGPIRSGKKKEGEA